MGTAHLQLFPILAGPGPPLLGMFLTPPSPSPRHHSLKSGRNEEACELVSQSVSQLVSEVVSP